MLTRGLLRTNEVHGEQEAKLVLRSGFLLTKANVQKGHRRWMSKRFGFESF